MHERPTILANTTDDDKRGTDLLLFFGKYITKDQLDDMKLDRRKRTFWPRLKYRLGRLFGGISG